MALYQREVKDDDDNDPTEIVIPQVKGGQPANQQQPNPPKPNDDDPWQKRYSDLRSYTQKQLNDMQKRLEDAERKAAQAEPARQLPKSKEDVEAWAAKYPDVYALVKSMIGFDLQATTEEVNSRFEQLSEREKANARREAEMELERYHPDFFTEIKDSEEFAEWLDSKSQRIQAALYENDTDAKAASEVISLYKYETGFGKPKKKTSNNNRDAAFDVPARHVPVTPSRGSGEYDFAESQVDSMTPREYEAVSDQIDEAIKNGRFLYDLTGAAR